jgi:hypothetical protein
LRIRKATERGVHFIIDENVSGAFVSSCCVGKFEGGMEIGVTALVAVSATVANGALSGRALGNGTGNVPTTIAHVGVQDTALFVLGATIRSAGDLGDSFIGVAAESDVFATVSVIKVEVSVITGGRDLAGLEGNSRESSNELHVGWLWAVVVVVVVASIDLCR